MQFSGVSHALAATAMRTSYFGSGYARKMQNGFYPRRSGDVILNFVPGCIEERDGCVSLSGSLYGYDTHVPLIFYGTCIRPQRISRRVEMTAVIADAGPHRRHHRTGSIGRRSIRRNRRFINRNYGQDTRGDHRGVLGFR